MRMKVLWVCSTPCSGIDRLSNQVYFGSWLRSLEEALSEQKEIQLHVCFYWPHEMAPFTYNNSKFYPVLRERKKTSIGRALWRHLKRNDDFTEINRLNAIVKKVSPDIIHIHGTEENFGLLQKHNNLPTVVSLQGIINPYLKKFYAGIPQVVAKKYEGPLSKILALSTDAHHKRFQFQAKRELEIFNISKNFIGRTAWDREQASIMNSTAKYYHAEELLRPAFYSKQWSKSGFSNPLQLVTTSSDSVYKGFELIVETCALLKKNGINFVWKVIGLSSSSSLVKIVENWKKTKTQDLNIELLGNCNEVQICETLLQADMYCQVSHIENSPNSLCEAMMLGVPIIASNCGGTPSLLVSGKEGVLYTPGNTIELCNYIVAYSLDFENSKRMAAAAREKAVQRHNKKNTVEQYISIYANTIK